MPGRLNKRNTIQATGRLNRGIPTQVNPVKNIIPQQQPPVLGRLQPLVDKQKIDTNLEQTRGIKQGVLANYPSALKDTAVKGVKSITSMLIDFEKKAGTQLGSAIAVKTNDYKKAREGAAKVDNASLSLVRQIKENNRIGNDSSRLISQLNVNKSNRTSASDIVPELNRTTLQELADWAGVGLDVLTAGLAEKTGSAFIKQSAKLGGGFGLTSYLSDTKDASIPGAIGSAAIGAAGGALLAKGGQVLGRLNKKIASKGSRLAIKELASSEGKIEPLVERAFKKAGTKTVRSLARDVRAKDEQLISKPNKSILKDVTDHSEALRSKPVSDISTPKGTKKSRFAQGVAGSKKTVPEVAQGLSDNPVIFKAASNRATKEAAQKRVATSVKDAENFVLKESKPSAEHTATAIELIKKLQSEGDHESAIRIAESVSGKLTQAGQAIQAAKLYENLSPESILLRAKTFLIKENSKKNRFQRPRQITKEDAQRLYEAAVKMQDLKGFAKTEVANEISSILAAYKNITVGKQISSIQTQAQLLNPKTLVRNVLGNEILYRFERLTKIAALPVDIVRSKLTGTQRTIILKKPKQGVFWKNFMEGGKAGFAGRQLGPDTQYQLPNKTFKSKWNPFYWGEKSVGASLKSFDYAAYKRAVEDTLYEFGYLKAKKEGMKGKALTNQAKYYASNAADTVREIADQYGKYVTFQDDNAISRLAIGTKKLLNNKKDFGIGDLVLKYPKTPGALLARALEYSPAGFLKNAHQIAKPLLLGKVKTPAENREFALTVGRAITGTLGFTGLGYYLADKGLISGRQSKDKDVRGLKKSTGQSRYQMNISGLKRWGLSGFKNTSTKEGDKLFTYDWAQPLAVSLSIGANLNNGDSTTPQDLAESLSSGIQTITEQPLISGLTRLFGYSDVLGGLKATAEGAGASFTPTLLNQFRQYTDNQARDVRSSSFLQNSANRVKTKVPGLARELPPKIDVMGKPIKNFEKNNIFSIFFNPGTLTTLRRSPEAKLVLDLITSTGETKQIPRVLSSKITVLGKKVELDRKDYAALQQYAGTKTKEGLENLLSQGDFNKLSDEGKVKVINSALRDVGTAVKSLLGARQLIEANKRGENTDEFGATLGKSEKKSLQKAIDFLNKNPNFFTATEIKKPKKSSLLNDVKINKSMIGMLVGGAALAVATEGKKTGPLRKAASELLSKEVPRLTTRILEKLGGRTIVSKQFIQDLLKSPGVKKEEIEIVNNTLSGIKGKVNVAEFTSKVRTSLLPLTQKTFKTSQYEHVNLKDTLRGKILKYNERVWKSPVSVNLSDIPHGQLTKEIKYFAHTRSEDLREGSKKIRRVLELQSDLYQKSGLARALSLGSEVKPGTLTKREYASLVSAGSNGKLTPSDDKSRYLVLALQRREGEIKQDYTKFLKQFAKKADRLQKIEHPFEIGNIIDEILGQATRVPQEALKKAAIPKTMLSLYNNPSAHLRVAREEIALAAREGQDIIRYPTGQTAMDIEGIGKLWTEDDIGEITNGFLIAGVEGHGEDVTAIPVALIKKHGYKPDADFIDKWSSGKLPEKLDDLIDDVSENFGSDVGGEVKDHAIYKFYEKTLAKFLKKNYDAKPITDKKGVTWFEVNIKSRYATEPVQAFDTNDLTILSRNTNDSRSKTLLARKPTIKKRKPKLTTVVLDKLAGRTVVSKQFITDLLKTPGVKKEEVDIITEALKEFEGKITIEDLATSVRAKILPLKNHTETFNAREGSKIFKGVDTPDSFLIRAMSSADSARYEAKRLGNDDDRMKVLNEIQDKYISPSKLKELKDGMERAAKLYDAHRAKKKTIYEGVSLPFDVQGDVSVYRESVYKSPIKLSESTAHFPQVKNYFGHVRAEDLADNTTRRVIEVQSDLYQKGRISREVFPVRADAKTLDNETLDRMIRAGSNDSLNIHDEEAKLFKDALKLFEKEIAQAPDDFANALASRTDDIGQAESQDAIEEIIKETLALSSKDLAAIRVNADRLLKSKKPLLQYSNPTAHFRMVREEIKQAAVDGKKKVLFPTGETAMKIEGLDTALPNVDVGDIHNGTLVFRTESEGEDVFGVPLSIIKSLGYESNIKLIRDFENDKLPGPVIEQLDNAMENIVGHLDENSPIFKFYEKTLQKFIKKNYNSTVVTDKQGITWVEVKLKPEDATKPVQAFGSAKLGPVIDIAAGGGLLAGILAAGNKKKKQSISKPKKIKRRTLQPGETEFNVKTGKSFQLENGKRVDKTGLLNTNVPLPQEKRKTAIATMWKSGIRRKVIPQYSKDVPVSKMRLETEARATTYDPNDVEQTRPGGDGTANGIKIVYGHVASSRRDIPKGTKIYVKELNKTFIVQDRLNGGYSEVKGYLQFDFAAPTGSKEDRLIRRNPKITFKIVK